MKRLEVGKQRKQYSVEQYVRKASPKSYTQVKRLSPKHQEAMHYSLTLLYSLCKDKKHPHFCRMSCPKVFSREHKYLDCSSSQCIQTSITHHCTSFTLISKKPTSLLLQNFFFPSTETELHPQLV